MTGSPCASEHCPVAVGMRCSSDKVLSHKQHDAGNVAVIVDAGESVSTCACVARVVSQVSIAQSAPCKQNSITQVARSVLGVLGHGLVALGERQYSHCTVRPALGIDDIRCGTLRADL